MNATAADAISKSSQRITEPALTTCDVCGGDVRRLLSAAPFILKGEGWYVTDYPSASRKKAMESDKGGGQDRPTGRRQGDADRARRQATRPKRPPALRRLLRAPSASSSPTKSD